MRLAKILAIASLIFGAIGMSPANAQYEEYGEHALGGQTYEIFCATCHGMSGKGDGPMAMMMTSKIADLTQLSANNGGEFPMLSVIAIIDGREGLRGHGGPMPIYGELFAEDYFDEYGTLRAEAIARGRMMALALYLVSIQE